MAGLADKIIGHYEKHATAWDALRQSCPWNDKVWHDRFIGGLQQGAQVLDLGCGSGRPIAQHMIDRGLRHRHRFIGDDDHALSRTPARS
jgi:ubiquinone/menaquinone biosynthesis C-methylase UbiE